MPFQFLVGKLVGHLVLSVSQMMHYEARVCADVRLRKINVRLSDVVHVTREYRKDLANIGVVGAGNCICQLHGVLSRPISCPLDSVAFDKLDTQPGNPFKTSKILAETEDTVPNVPHLDGFIRVWRVDVQGYVLDPVEAWDVAFDLEAPLRELVEAHALAGDVERELLLPFSQVCCCFAVDGFVGAEEAWLGCRVKAFVVYLLSEL